MNGGLLDALESDSDAELSAAVSGYRFFGLDAAAEVIGDVRARLDAGLSEDEADALESDADERYAAVIAEDEVIYAAFRAHFASHPLDFAPTD